MLSESWWMVDGVSPPPPGNVSTYSTVGGSARKVADALREKGAEIVAYAALANRGICKRHGESENEKPECKLEEKIPLFTLGNFHFETYDPADCPMCKAGMGEAVKPGSKG